MTDYLDVAQLTSLLLTGPTLILALAVIWFYGPKAVQSLREGSWRPCKMNERDMLIMGITVSFIGAFLDNLYWGFAWSAEFLSLPQRDWLFDHGAVANVPFRQGSGIVAAIFHLLPIYYLKRGQRG